MERGEFKRMRTYLKSPANVKHKKMPFKEERFGYQIITNVVFRFLQKAGYISRFEKEELEEPTVTIIESKQITAMEEFQKQYLILMRNNQEPKTVIIGRNCFHELRHYYLERCYTFPVYDNDLRFGVNGDMFKMQGLKGIIVPNFEGILVLPYEFKN